MSLIGAMLDVVKWLRDIDRELEHVKTAQREANRLLQENLTLARELQVEFSELAQLAGDLRVAMPLITEIRDAVVGKPVAKVVLLVNHQPPGGNMNVVPGQVKNLSFQALDANGNPTTPLTTPVWASSDTTNFSLAVAADSMSAVMTALTSGAVGSENSVDVTVDGIESNILVFDIVAPPPPPPNPVASVVLTASDPAQAKK